MAEESGGERATLIEGHGRRWTVPRRPDAACAIQVGSLTKDLKSTYLITTLHQFKSIPCKAAINTSPSCFVGQITSLVTLKTSSPSYPRALFLPFLFLPALETPTGSSVRCTSDWVARTIVSDGRIDFASLVGKRVEWKGWQQRRVVWMASRKGRRSELQT